MISQHWEKKYKKYGIIALEKKITYCIPITPCDFMCYH